MQSHIDFYIPEQMLLIRVHNEYSTGYAYGRLKIKKAKMLLLFKYINGVQLSV